MVISQRRTAETRDRSLHRVQGFPTSAVAGSYAGGGDGGSHSNVYQDQDGSFRRRGRSPHVSREVQGMARTNSSDRGFSSPELLNEEHHSGLEGYGRHLGSLEEPSSHNHFHHAMESSDFTMDSNDMQNQLDSVSLFCLDNSLESYGRYLGSSPEPGYFSDSNQTGVLTNLQETNSFRSTELSGGSLSDYAGLGRYSQPSCESTNFSFSRELQMEDAEFTSYGGYGGGLF